VTSSDERSRVLLELARGLGREDRELDQAFGRACAAAASAIGVERVGIWLVDETRSRLSCVCLHRQSSEDRESGLPQETRGHRGYLAALAAERIVAAEDAARDPRTAGFTEIYLRPNGIGAVLDAPVFLAGELAGVVCHEHVGGPRLWTVEDRSFAASIADFIGIAWAEHERRQAARALETSERRFRLLAENSTDMITALDRHGTLLYASPSHLDGIGIAPEDLVGSPAYARVHPDDVATVVETIERGFDARSPGGASFRYRHADGRWLWLEARGRVFQNPDAELRAVITARDVTARVEAEAATRELEAQLSQMQRLEAVGRLAGGIAHDFNNLLTAMLGHLEAAEERDAAGQPVAEELAEMGAVVRRAADLTQQLLSLGRSRATDPYGVDPGEAIASLASVIRRVIGEDVELHVEIEPALPHVRLDPTQIDQILMNLVINARDAMPEGGRLSIRAWCQAPDAPAPASCDGSAGEEVWIEVRDDGTGMDAATCERVFDPFFTTKHSGRGAGLGLSTVYQVVRQASGRIDLHSEPGEGTTVSIRLPALDRVEPAVRTEPALPERDLAGRECILLVEDETSVRRTLEANLSRRGYQILTAGNGTEALAVLARHGGAVKVVVSDVVMPGMGGLELARAVARDHAGVKVLLVSGYAPPSCDRDALLPGDGILRKPFTADELLREVRALLDGDATHGVGPSTIVSGARA